MKDDCEGEFHLRLQSQGCIFQKKSWGHGPLCTCRHMHKRIHAQRHRRMHGCIIIYKGNSLKSLSREVVTSAALFTRLMPRCTQERVNQARGYTRCPEPASSSSRSFPSLVGHTNFSRAEVGGVMGRGKNTYGDRSQVSVSQWNVRNVSRT